MVTDPVPRPPFVNPHSSILVGQIGSVFWLRVDGKGCFQNSLSIKAAVQDRIASGVRDFVFDLDRCPMMDSTFMGTLTGVARDLRECGGGTVTVLNVNARNQQLLSSLGLDHVLTVDADGTAWAEERRQVACELEHCASVSGVCKETQAAHVLEAHQALCEANAANSSRFRDVIDFLEKEVNRKPEPVGA